MRALDVKLRKLRSMLTADEDISTELDKVVCRLMKLALKTSKGSQDPPPSRWMQCKLFDLLSLTEKSIERRKKRFIDNYSLQSLQQDDQGQRSKDLLAIANIKEDSVNKLVDKYRYIVQSYDSQFINDDRLNIVDTVIESGFNYTSLYNGDETKLQRVQAWVDDDIEVVPYPNHDICDINSGDTDNSHSTVGHQRFKKSTRKKNASVALKDIAVRRKNDKYRKIKYDNKIDSKNIKSSKKMSKKKSSYSILIKTYKTKASSINHGNYMIRNKVKYEDKNQQKLQSNISKPIPESLITLCSPEIKIKNNVEQIPCSVTELKRKDSPDLIIENEQQTNIAATEESLLIDIVMDGAQETVALRRTIGTDAIKNTAESKQEINFGSVNIVMREDSFCNTHERTTGNVQSQTIFLYDINEPCSSKGLRHISMDVQCGPDATTSSFPVLSSFTNCFSTGINGDDLSGNIKTQKSTDFGTSTCTDGCNADWKIISPRIRSVSIKIKDSDPVICEKTECSTITCCQDSIIDNVVCTKDSCLELYECGEIHRKSSSQFASSSKNTIDVHLKSLVNEEIRDKGKYLFTKYICPKLCRGGVHVHSYKEQLESSDVIFQGQWQRDKLKPLSKKRIVYNSGIIKKVTDMPKKTVNCKEKTRENKLTKYEDKMERKKSTQKLVRIRTHTAAMDKKKAGTIGKKTNSNNLIKSTKFSRNSTKVASKSAISSDTCNKVKYGLDPKKSVAIVSVGAKKVSDLENQINKKYIPIHWNRNKSKLVTNKRVVKKNMASFKTETNAHKNKYGEQAPLLVSKTADVRKQLLKLPVEPRDNIHFFVYRNDTSSNINDVELLESSEGNTKKRDSSVKRTYSPRSQNSSSCSSPNSVATVRVVRPKMISTRKHSTSPNVVNIDSETITFPSNKKSKKIKLCKKTDDANFDNKENIPESSTKCNINEKCDKIASLVGGNNIVYRAQTTTESELLQDALNSVSMQISHSPIKSNMKFTTDDKRSVNGTLSQSRTSISPLLSVRKTSSNKTFALRSKAVSVQDIHKNADGVYMLESEQDLENKIFGQYVNTQNKSSNNIFTDFKHMIEERLTFIDNILDTPIDSEIEIISRDDLRNTSVFESSSSVSFKTVNTNEDFNSSRRDDIEIVMNRTSESMLVDVSDMVVNSTDVNSTDKDLLSFTSITTPVSRMSEYFLADTELNNIEAYVRSESSVRDVFEKKEEIPIPGTAGSLAMQAFSGFSMNLEPVGGDRLDPVSLIDSETGSMALEMARQSVSTSEELLTSGRSSGTYESCFIDEDAMLPYWLFQNNHSVDEEESEDIMHIPIPVPHPEHMYDVNGNALPEVGVGAGAGDGCGVHSDTSQDSSGRGTTTSSSEPSSDVESEAILIDSSVLAVQFEMIREAIENSDTRPLSTSIAGEHNDDVSTSRNGHRNPVMPLATSDMDADVSSLDTDILDSSDN